MMMGVTVVMIVPTRTNRCGEYKKNMRERERERERDKGEDTPRLLVFQAHTNQLHSTMLNNQNKRNIRTLPTVFHSIPKTIT